MSGWRLDLFDNSNGSCVLSKFRVVSSNIKASTYYRVLSTTFNLKVLSHLYLLSADTKYKHKIQSQKAVFVEREREGGLYRIYELEGQTLGFRKIYDWLNKLKQTTSQTKNTFLFEVWGGGQSKKLEIVEKMLC